MNSRPLDDELALGSVVRMVEDARRHCAWYAGDLAPLTTSDLWQLTRDLGCRLDFYRFESDVPAMAFPFAGYYLLLVNQRSEKKDQLFGARHELGHVLRQDVDVEGAVFLSDADYTSASERACDLFAFADLIPSRTIRFLRSMRTPWRDVLTDVRAMVAGYAPDWPSDRIEDRARLRVRLFRECGL